MSNPDLEPTYRVTKLAPEHDLGAFDCGEPSYNEWLVRHDASSVQAGVSAVYVLLEEQDETSRVVGYYAINPTQVARDDVPESLARGWPHTVPAWNLGKLAVHVDLRADKNAHWGRQLLRDALETIVRVADSGGAKGHRRRRRQRRPPRLLLTQRIQEQRHRGRPRVVHEDLNGPKSTRRVERGGSPWGSKLKAARDEIRHEVELLVDQMVYEHVGQSTVQLDDIATRVTAEQFGLAGIGPQQPKQNANRRVLAGPRSDQGAHGHRRASPRSPIL